MCRQRRARGCGPGARVWLDPVLTDVVLLGEADREKWAGFTHVMCAEPPRW